MRSFIILSLFTFLSACSLGGSVENPKAEKPQKAQEEQLQEKMEAWIKQQLSQDRFSFTIEMGEKKKNIYKGQQIGEDWSLEGENEIRIVKKGDKIHLSSKGKKETLTTDQFGLLSPRDHLMLIRGAGNVDKMIMKQKKVLQIQLSNKAMSEKLEQRLSDQIASPQIAERVAKKNRILYELVYEPEKNQLNQLKVRILLQDEEDEEIILYHFQG